MTKVKDFVCSTNWCQGALALHKDGIVVLDCWVYSPSACQWCLTGMILFCYRDTKTQVEILDKVTKYLESDPKKQPQAIARWNDAKGRTWEDVRALATELDI